MRVYNAMRAMKPKSGFTPHVPTRATLLKCVLTRSGFAFRRSGLKLSRAEHAGFTLIELLVVISIIGTLATLSVVSLNNARAKARDARRVSDVRQIQTALELYYFDHDGYPIAAALLGQTDYVCLGNAGFSSLGTACATPYMRIIPTNPGPIGTPYSYTGVDGSGYSITFSLETGAGGLVPGLHTAFQDGVQ